MAEPNEPRNPPAQKRSAIIIRNIERFIAIGASVFGIWAFFQARQVSSFTYFFSSPAKIFDSKSASNISLSDAQGRQIRNDVYLQEIVLWNNGDRPIEPRDIRAPITFGPESNIILEEQRGFGLSQGVTNRLLEFKVSQQVAPTISQLEVQISQKSNEPRLVVSWKHFDPGDAAKIQLIYESSGDNAPSMNISGKILGVDRLTDGNVDAFKRFVPWLPGRASWWSLIISGSGIIAYFLVSIFRKRLSPIWVILIFYGIGMAILYLGNSQITPPLPINR